VVFSKYGRLLLKILLPFAAALTSYGYSVLSHEALVDAVWEIAFKPALLARFPHATPEQLKEAHAYAYGGAIIQDAGFYPHGNGYFSDLTHYCRSGDFIEALVSDAQTLDEYAFALGALSHYASDNDGHRLATNVGEPLLYPKLRRQFGNVVTYEAKPYVHLQTEFAFDVEEVAKGNYAPEAYHDFIGFNVAKPLLQRAFFETYGFELTDIILDFDRAMGSYRHTLSRLIPFFTRVAWAAHQDEIRKARPTVTERQFLYVMSRSSYEREWGKQYDRPTARDRLAAFLLKVLPPIGHLRTLKFKPLTPEVEQLFMRSFDVAVKQYTGEIRESRDRTLHLENTNFDVGTVTRPGEYKLQDQTYAYWLDELALHNFTGVTPGVREDILKYYRDLDASFDTKKHPQDWEKLTKQLDELKRTAPDGNGDRAETLK